MLNSPKSKSKEMDGEALLEKAKHCNSCNCWTEICNAECCRQFKISRKSEMHITGSMISYKVPSSIDLQKYLLLHGCKIAHGRLIIKNADFAITQDEESFYFTRDCDWLENNKCKFYIERPLLCRDYDERTGLTSKGDVYATPKCLCQFKEEKKC